MPIPKREREIMRRYGAAERTARKWIAEGCPDNDAAAMRSWIAARRSRPKATQAILNAQMRDKLVKAAKGVVASTSAGGTGAPSAQKRLEGFEKVLSEVFGQAAASGDPAMLKAVSDVYFRCTSNLLSYDLKVDRARRSNDELIARGECETHIKNFMRFLRIALTGAASRIAEASEGLGVGDMSTLVRDVFHDHVLTTLGVMASKPCPARVPDWFLKAATSPMADSFSDPDSIVEARGKAVEEIFGVLVAANTEQRAEMLIELRRKEAERDARDVARAENTTAPTATSEAQPADHPEQAEQADREAWGSPGGLPTAV
jgi:hypothetical protein